MNSYYKNIFSNYQDYDMTQHTMAQQDQPQASTRPPIQTKPQLTSPQQTQMQRPPQAPSTALIDQYTYPQNLQSALQLILDALNTEAEDAQFYQYLVNQAPMQEDKTIIMNIQKDELGHYHLLNQIYSNLTGKTPPELLPYAGRIPTVTNYCQGLYTAFLGEIRDGSRYRKILYALQDRININMMTEIVADEIEHASLYSFLYSKNRCGSISSTQF